eukprot:4988046-Ditylum_brightwellii.AAC.1
MGGKKSTDTEFHFWDQHTSNHLQWDFQTEEEKNTLFIMRKNVPEAPKKGGITWEFDENNDGRFPALNIWPFGLKNWCWKDFFQHWAYAELAPGMTEDDMDPYWKTNQLIEHFNDHHMRNFEHRWKNQPGGGHKCECKPQQFGPEYKCILRYTKEYGTGAASVLHLAEKSGITGTSCVVIADSWFGEVRLPPGLRKMGLHNISMIKTGSAGFCKEDDIEQGSHALAKTSIDGVELVTLAHCGKSHHGKKSNVKKSNFYSYFIATDCVTTLYGKPSGKSVTILMAATYHQSL